MCRRGLENIHQSNKARTKRQKDHYYQLLKKGESQFTANIFSILHIHVFHTNDLFSQFQYKAGKYNYFNKNNEKKLIYKYYSFKITSEGQLSENKLVKLFLNESNRKI